MKQSFENIIKLIKQHKNIIIMTHRSPDLDGLGTSLCLYEIIKKMNKECYIFTTNDIVDSSFKNAIKKIREKKLKIEFINKTKYKNKLHENTLLIIVDVYKKELLEYPEILNEIKDVIVIDHHVKGKTHIETIYNYINPNVSSTTEITVNYLKYLNQTIDPLIATIMLAGIEIDTNAYNYKTTEKTFEASAYLMKQKADNVIKQELLKEDKEVYIKRQQFIKTSKLINKNMALCIMDNNIYNKRDLASLSEELLQFENIEASFTIGRIDKNTIGISARSLGKINVEKIMSKLNGGGHITDAATQFENITIKQAALKLTEIL